MPDVLAKDIHQDDWLLQIALQVEPSNKPVSLDDGPIGGRRWRRRKDATTLNRAALRGNKPTRTNAAMMASHAHAS